MPFDIIYRDFPESEAVSAAIEKNVAKLDKFVNGRAVSCHVVVSSPHRHHNKGHIYHVEVRLHVGNKDIVANHEPEKNHAHEDVMVAVRDAFSAAERQLKDYVGKHQH